MHFKTSKYKAHLKSIGKFYSTNLHRTLIRDLISDRSFGNGYEKDEMKDYLYCSVISLRKNFIGLNLDLHF